MVDHEDAVPRREYRRFRGYVYGHMATLSPWVSD